MRTLVIRALLVLTFLSIALSAAAQQELRPEFVLEANPVNDSSSPHSFTEFRGDVYFLAQEERDRQALWKYDGATTTKILEPDESYGESDESDILVVFDDELFIAMHIDGEWELLAYDGTTFEKMSDRFPRMPTVRAVGHYNRLLVWEDVLLINESDSIFAYSNNTLRNLGQAAAYSDPVRDCSPRCPKVNGVQFQGKLYFIGYADGHKNSLVTFDGTSLDRVTQVDSTFLATLSSLTAGSGKLYFVSKRDSVDQIFSYDGVLVEQVTNFNSTVYAPDPSRLFAYDDDLLFTARSDAGEWQLWRIRDNVAENLNIGLNTSHPEYTLVEDKLFFMSGTSGRWHDIYSYDGETVIHIQNSFPDPTVIAIGGLAALQNNLYFTGETDENGIELFRYDGESIRLVFEGYPGDLSGYPTGPKVVSNKIFFALGYSLFGREPAMISTVGAPPIMLADINKTSFDTWVNNFAKYGRDIYFDTFNKLQRFNPIILDLETVFEPDNYGNLQTSVVGDDLFFVADSDTYGEELWRFAEPTSDVIDLNTGGGGSVPHDLTELNDELYFVASDQNSRGIWKYSAGSPEKILDDGIYSSLTLLGSYQNVLYFSQVSSSGYIQLKSMVSGNTNVLATLSEDFSFHTTFLHGHNDNIYFNSSTRATGDELWRYVPDDTSSLFFDINPGRASSLPSDFQTVNDSLFFFATMPDVGRELFVVDGDSVRIVGEVVPGTFDSKPDELTAFDGALYWTAINARSRREMYRYEDGKIEMLADVFSEPIGWDPTTLTVLEAELYFTAKDSNHGREIWRLTKSGTSTIEDSEQPRPKSLEIKRLFPNPASDNIEMTISARDNQEIQVTVYDVLGRKIAVAFNGPATRTRPLNLSIDVSSFPSGLYFVQATGPRNAGSAVESFVVVP